MAFSFKMLEFILDQVLFFVGSIICRWIGQEARGVPA